LEVVVKSLYPNLMGGEGLATTPRAIAARRGLKESVMSKRADVDGPEHGYKVWRASDEAVPLTAKSHIHPGLAKA